MQDRHGLARTLTNPRRCQIQLQNRLPGCHHPQLPCVPHNPSARIREPLPRVSPFYMSTLLPQCLSGRAVTPQRLGGGSSLLYKGAAAAVSRLGFCVRGDSYSCCCRSRSGSGSGSGSSGVRGMWTRVKPRASDQAHTRGRRSGYGYGHALQKRRGLCSEARMNTGVDARSASLFIRDPARVVSLFILFLNFTLRTSLTLVRI